MKTKPKKILLQSCVKTDIQGIFALNALTLKKKNMKEQVRMNVQNASKHGST